MSIAIETCKTCGGSDLVAKVVKDEEEIKEIKEVKKDE